MSLKTVLSHEIPEDTAEVVRRMRGKPGLLVMMRDHFGTIFTDEQFTDLFSERGQPAVAPWKLAFITVMQFALDLSDREVMEAIRYGIDWKYALSMHLDDPVFDPSVLVEFRARLLDGGAERRILDTLLEVFLQHGLIKKRGKQRTDSTHIIANIRVLSRLECIGETMRHALNEIISLAPEWAAQKIPLCWKERYGCRYSQYRLPKKGVKVVEIAHDIGSDGFQLLQALYQSGAPNETSARLSALPAVETLRQVWLQQFYAPNGPVQWRSPEDLPPSSLLISSPYDPEARYAKKRDTEWTGYKSHLTETCEPEQPELVVDVETTLSTIEDREATPRIQARLAQRGLLPKTQAVDMGYMSIEQVTRAYKEHQVEMLGPMMPDTSWQARTEGGLCVSQFEIDWQDKRVRCPAGKQSVTWRDDKDKRGHHLVRVSFASKDCKQCRYKPQCAKSENGGRRITLRTQQQHELLQSLRQRESTKDFKKRYKIRAGIEACISQIVRRCDARHARYTGLAKTELQQILCAAGLNALRVGAWLAGTSRARSRSTPLQELGKPDHVSLLGTSTLCPS